MQIHITKKQLRDLFIESENNCSLCGEKLELKHKVNFIEQLVVEENICRCCGIRSKKRNHDLH